MSGLRSKDIDLLKVYKQKKEPSPYTKLIKYLAFPIGASVILLSCYGYLFFQNHRMTNEIADTKAELAQVQKEIAEDPNLEKYKSLQKAISDVEKYKTLHKNLQSYPQLTQNIFDQILIASDVNTNVVGFSYQRESEVITLQVEAATADETEQFVRRLKATNLFEKVDYSGYAQTEKTLDDGTSDTTTENTTQEPETKTKDTTDETESASKELLDLLNKAAQQNKQTTQKQTTTVYTATVLCTLK